MHKNCNFLNHLSSKFIIKYLTTQEKKKVEIRNIKIKFKPNFTGFLLFNYVHSEKFSIQQGLGCIEKNSGNSYSDKSCRT